MHIPLSWFTAFLYNFTVQTQFMNFTFSKIYHFISGACQGVWKLMGWLKGKTNFANYNYNKLNYTPKINTPPSPTPHILKLKKRSLNLNRHRLKTYYAASRIHLKIILYPENMIFKILYKILGKEKSPSPKIWYTLPDYFNKTSKNLDYKVVLNSSKT